MLITVSMRRRRARHRNSSVSRARDRPECASTVMMFLGWDDLEHLHARPNLREAQKMQRGVRMELARFLQRGIGHDHRPHLGELNEQDVPRPAGRRGRQADEALDAGDDSGERRAEFRPSSRWPASGPDSRQSRFVAYCVAWFALVHRAFRVIDTANYAAIEPARGSDSSSPTVRSGCRRSSRTVAQPILRRWCARIAKSRTVVM